MHCPQGFLSTAADRRHDRNLRSSGQRTHKPAGIADIFVSDEDIDVLSNLSLLGRDAISNPRVEDPQRRQSIAHRRRRVFYFKSAVPLSEFAQGTRDVEGHRHDHLLVRRDLYFAVWRELLATRTPPAEVQL